MGMIEKTAIIPIVHRKGAKPQIVIDKVKRRIYRRGRSSVFTADDFADISNRASIDLALYRLAKRGTIWRITRGLYLYPEFEPNLAVAAPSVEAIASALAAAGRMRLQPSGAYAANLLGLSEQVPMKVVYLTDGGSRRVRVDRGEIIFRRASPRNMATAGRLGGLVIQALRYLGPDAVDDNLIRRLRASVPEEKRKLRSTSWRARQGRCVCRSSRNGSSLRAPPRSSSPPRYLTRPSASSSVRTFSGRRRAAPLTGQDDSPRVHSLASSRSRRVWRDFGRGQPSLSPKRRPHPRRLHLPLISFRSASTVRLRWTARELGETQGVLRRRSYRTLQVKQEPRWS